MKKVVLLMFAMLLMLGCAGSAEEQLKAEIESYQQELPEIMGNGLVMTDCQLLPNEVLYICEMDENYYSLEDSREIRQFLKEAISEGFIEEQDEDVKEMLRLCIETDRGVSYRYVGDQTWQYHHSSSYCARFEGYNQKNVM